MAVPDAKNLPSCSPFLFPWLNDTQKEVAPWHKFVSWDDATVCSRSSTDYFFFLTKKPNPQTQNQRGVSQFYLVPYHKDLFFQKLRCCCCCCWTQFIHNRLQLCVARFKFQPLRRPAAYSRSCRNCRHTSLSLLQI